jgi:hypothetical protein
MEILEFFDFLNTQIADNPAALAQLELMFRIKFWLLLLLAAYFLSLPYREQKKRAAKGRNQTVQPNGKDGNFLA